MSHLLPRLLGLLAVATTVPARGAADCFVIFGTHRSGPHIGFSLARFNPATGTLTKPAFLAEAVEPGFFVIHPDGRHLYTCNADNVGGVSAYAVDPATARLTLLNQVSSGGSDPAYISLDRTGRFVLVANYNAGNLAVFALEPDGRIGRRTAFEQHAGHSVNPTRQTQPHVHSIIVDPSNRYVLSADLGLDRLYVYRFDAATGSLAPADPPYVAARPGSGPRHVTFHPNGRWVYLDCEMANTVTAFAWDSGTGRLSEIQTVSSLPPGFEGTSTAAEILVHPGGRFLYVSNRGHDSLAAFAIDAATGRLSPVGWTPSGGRTPRNFAFDPTGRWLLVTNHDSDNAVVFRVDDQTGRLQQAGPPIPAPYPFGVRFLDAP